MKKIPISSLFESVLQNMLSSSLSCKTITEFKRYGMMPILQRFKDKKLKFYDYAESWKLVLEMRAKCERREMSVYCWRYLRRAAKYFLQMAESGQIARIPMPSWEAEHNPLFCIPTKEQLCDPKNITAIVYLTLKAFARLGLSEKTILNYTYDGFGDVLKFFSKNKVSIYSEKLLDELVVCTRADYIQAKIDRSKCNNIRKVVEYIKEFYRNGKIEWKHLNRCNFVYANDSNESLLAEYANYNFKLNALKKSSITVYTLAIRRFMRCLEKMGIGSFTKIQFADVGKGILEIAKAAPRSVGSMLNAMRSFAYFLREKHAELPDISPGLIGIPAKHKRVYEGYTAEEATLLFKTIDTTTLIGKRDYAMMMIAYNTGLRGIDISKLKIENVNWHRMEFNLIQEKTGVAIALPFEADTGNALADYILNARPSNESKIIFISSRKPYRGLNSQSMWSIFSRHTIPVLGHISNKKHGPHAFRRGLGTRMLDGGVSHNLISDVLGHRDYDSISPYISVSLTGLRLCAGNLDGISVESELIAKELDRNDKA